MSHSYSCQSINEREIHRSSIKNKYIIRDKNDTREKYRKIKRRTSKETENADSFFLFSEIRSKTTNRQAGAQARQTERQTDTQSTDTQKPRRTKGKRKGDRHSRHGISKIVSAQSVEATIQYIPPGARKLSSRCALPLIQLSPTRVVRRKTHSF